MRNVIGVIATTVIVLGACKSAGDDDHPSGATGGSAGAAGVATGGSSRTGGSAATGGSMATGGSAATGGSDATGGTGAGAGGGATGGGVTAGGEGNALGGGGATAGSTASSGGSGGGGASAGGGGGASGSGAETVGASGAAGAGGVAGTSGAAGAIGAAGASGVAGTSGASGAGGATCSPSVTTTTCSDLVEPGLGTWTASGEGSPATTQAWLPDGPLGQSLRITTDAAFAVRLDLTLESPVDASTTDELVVLLRCENASPVGWQMNVPRLTLTDAAGGELVLEPTAPLVPRDGVTWVSLHAPLAGGGGWSASGTAELARLAGVALELDTWDAGFRLDVGGMAFVRTGEECAAQCPDACSSHGRCSEAGNCDCEFGFGGASCAECADGFVASGNRCDLALDGSYPDWPNPVSSSNSDPWLVAHHDEIAVLRPKLLVLNFANPSTAEGVAALVDGIVAALREGSRFHGYADPDAPPQLEYDVLEIRDLRDGVGGRPPAPADYPYENSTLFPRAGAEGSLYLDYARFFAEDFAPYLAFADPSAPDGYLDLCRLVDEGRIHELWMVGSGDVPDAAAAEVLEHKPVYDVGGNRTGAVERCAGNGCFAEDVPYCGRSLRIGFVNYARGAGCFIESEAHGIESAGSRHLLPGLSEWFVPFAGFDLDRRYDLPFSSFYGCPYGDLTCVLHPTSSSVEVTIDGQTYPVMDFDPRCGSVHFAPTARGHYDLGNPQSVLSSCRDFGTGPRCGEDPTSAVSNEEFARYAELASDCQGPFLVWWLQNMPGHATGRRFADGTPMKAFWPFLFY